MMPTVHRRCAALLAFALALMLAPTSVHAQGVFVVTEPWVRPASAAGSTRAFMELSSSEGATLIDVRCAAAASVSLMNGQGRPVVPIALPLPAGATVLLAPARFQLALGRLTRPLRLGERVPLTLVIRNADGTTQEIAVDAEVRLRSPTDDHRHPHQHPAPGA